jgi:hypothetical protein
MITDIYQHPRFQQERRALAQSERRREQLEDMLRVSLNRDLQTKDLEPVNAHPGGMLAPLAGGTLSIHVDALRIRSNRVNRARDPIIRILHADQVWHCHEIRLTGPSWMTEDYERHLPGKPSAVCVLQTASPIEVIR